MSVLEAELQTHGARHRAPSDTSLRAAARPENCSFSKHIQFVSKEGHSSCHPAYSGESKKAQGLSHHPWSRLPTLTTILFDCPLGKILQRPVLGDLSLWRQLGVAESTRPSHSRHPGNSPGLKTPRAAPPEVGAEVQPVPKEPRTPALGHMARDLP